MRQQPSPAVEQLESRQMLSAAAPGATPMIAKPVKVLSAILDNRGQATLNMSVGLDMSTVSRRTAAIYTAGPDNTFATADDVRLFTTVGYKKGRLTLTADGLTAYQKYRVRLNSAVIKDVNGRFLDGEFNGAGVPSGNGKAGGDYDVVADTSSKTQARLTTPLGFINVGLYKNTPIAKSNFVHYSNEAAYDYSVFHRAMHATDQVDAGNGTFQPAGIDIVQGGGYAMNYKRNKTVEIHNHGEFDNEAQNRNGRGTIAMANRGPNTNTTQWYFNVGNNTGLDQTPGSYTVFGAVLDDASLATIRALWGLPTSQNDTYPLADTTGKNVPVWSVKAINDRKAFSPKDDLIVVQRVAMLMDVKASAGITASALPASKSAAAANAPAALPPVAATFSAAKVDEKNSVLSDAAAA